MENVPATRGTQDITVVWVVFILLVLGLILAYWFLLYQPKMDQIRMTQQSIASKESTLQQYKQEASELLNYEDQFAALVYQWNKNQHFFVNGLIWDQTTGTYEPPYKDREQFAIFDALQDVWGAARFAGVNLTEMNVSEDLSFYMDDDPFEVPDELRQSIGWEPTLQERGENTNPLFTSHNFSIKFFGDLEGTKRFIEIIQKLEGEVTKIFSIHCFETADTAAYRRDIIGFGDVILTDISLEMDVFMSVHELNPAATTANTPPDLPGQASCSYGGSGSSRGGGGGGGTGGSGGGVGLGL